MKWKKKNSIIHLNNKKNIFSILALSSCWCFVRDHIATQYHTYRHQTQNKRIDFVCVLCMVNTWQYVEHGIYTNICTMCYICHVTSLKKLIKREKKNFNNKILTFKKIQKKGKYMREEITLHLHRIISCPLRNFNNNI